MRIDGIYLNIITTLCLLIMSSSCLAQVDNIDSKKQNPTSTEMEWRLLLLDSASKALKHDYQGALNVCAEVLKKDPDNIQAYLQSGLVRIILKNEKEGNEDIYKAQMLIDRSLKQSPNDAHLYFLRGKASRYLKEYDQAIVDTKKAIELDPKRSAYAIDLKGIEVEKEMFLNKNKSTTK